MLSVKKLLLTDYVSFLLAIGPPITLVLFVGAMLIGGLPSRSGKFIPFSDLRMILLALASITTALCVPLLLRRIGSFRELFQIGRQVDGWITTVWFVKDRGRVEYEFEFEGRRRTGWNAVMKNKATTSLREGQQVTIVVDANRPNRTVIRELFVT